MDNKTDNMECPQRDCIEPPRKYQRLKIEGLTEEQKQRIIKDKRNAYYRERRAKAKKEREEGVRGQRPIKPKNMYFTIKPESGETTFEDAMLFRRKLSDLCQEYKFLGKETLEPRFAIHLENEEYCRIEFPQKSARSSNCDA